MREAEPLHDGKLTLIGASGAELKIDSWFVMHFSIEGGNIYSCYVGDSVGLICFWV